MSSFSKRLIDEISLMNESLAVDEDDSLDESFLEIEIQYEYIPGFRKGSKIVWVLQEKNLYYVNSFSNKTKLTACTCYETSCTARIFIKEDGTAYKEKGHKHKKSHGSHYEIFKHMHCFNMMKNKAASSPASIQPYEIYKEVLLE